MLNERAMLTVLSMSTWTARKVDKEVTHRTNQDHDAAADASRVNKQLVSKAALADIVTLRNSARSYHYARTLPWLDDGARILPAKIYDDYWRTIEGMRMTFDQKVSDFLSGYDDYVRDAERSLGRMFKRGDYPSQSDIARKFGFGVRLLPLPNADDFRVSMSDDAAARIRADIEAGLQSAMGDAVADVFSRIHERVAHMVEKLGDKEARFHSTLVGNIAELVELLPGLNITDDARIDQLARDMKKLTRYDASALKDDDACRMAVHDDAAVILSQVSSFMA